MNQSTEDLVLRSNRISEAVDNLAKRFDDLFLRYWVDKTIKGD